MVRMSRVLTDQIVTQIGIVVRDIERTLQKYSSIFSIKQPNWFWTDPLEISKTTFNSAATEARAKIAFIKLGQVEIELIEPDEHPSTWRTHLDKYGEGVHHIAFIVNGMKQKIHKLSELGMPLIQKGEFNGGRYAYIDTLKELKVIIEFLELES